MIYFFVIMAVIIGTLMPVQAGLNAELTRVLKHPFLGAFVSLLTGALAVMLLIFAKGFEFQDIKRIGTVSPHLFLGGLLGAVFVGSSLFLIPRLGATSMIAAFITGQLLGSVVIDHYGLLGIAPSPLSLTRISGIFLLFVGAYLVLKKSA